MAKIIDQSQVTSRTPQRYVHVRLTATYILRVEALDFLDHTDISAATEAAVDRIREIISAAAERTYHRSGLHVRTGMLLAAAKLGFRLRLTNVGLTIFLEAEWQSDLAYFLRRLFGFRGFDSLGRFFRGRGFDAIKPQGWFLRLDADSNRQIRDTIEEELQARLRAKIPGARPEDRGFRRLATASPPTSLICGGERHRIYTVKASPPDRIPIPPAWRGQRSTPPPSRANGLRRLPRPCR